MKHIVSFSGGKDSTAMLLMMHERGMQIDDIVFCDTGLEFPAMYNHIDKVQKYIGRKITIIKAEKDFEYYFYEFDGKRKSNKYHDKKGYGFPSFNMRWCTVMLKKTPLKKYMNKYGDYIEYIGLARDETKRINTNGKRNISYPLVDWQITEKQALKYCYDKGFDWDGLYELFNRVSCWCCPLQSLAELKQLYINFPNLWKQLKIWDKYSREVVGRSFRQDYSISELENKFGKEIKADYNQLKIDV